MSDRLYAAMIAHYEKYSGPYGFADETQGQGRFDRYSVLLAAEIAQRFMETGEMPPREIVDWVRKSADVMLMRLNATGEGFEYGRSLGPYSETAIVEVLTAAAKLGVLSDDQKSLAYAFASRAARRYTEFWIDARTGSVNLWDEGRRTDAYRGKFRILGENLSLGHQYLYTNEAWNELGFKDVSPRADFVRALRTLPTRSVTWFARGDYDRVLVTVRDRGQLISLPLVNGGPGQHMHSPYFPIPFSNGLVSGVADATEPLLVPRFELADGTVLMPLAFFRDVKVEQSGPRTTVSWRQTEMDRMGSRDAVADGRLQVETRYVFEPGVITRTDTYRANSATRHQARAARDGFLLVAAAHQKAGHDVRQRVAARVQCRRISDLRIERRPRRRALSQQYRRVLESRRLFDRRIPAHGTADADVAAAVRRARRFALKAH